MLSYYTCILLLCWLALGSLCVLIHENDRLAAPGKRLLYLTYALIALSALAEWTGVQLDGRADLPTWLLRTAKCADYILTPMAGGALVAQMRLGNRWQRLLLGILGVNTVFQLAAVPQDWMIVVDAAHHYTHGPLFAVYLSVCLIIVGLVTVEFLIYGRSFRRQNRRSLYAVMLLLFVGVGMQEVLPGEPRTAYLALTLGAALMFIHYSEFASLALDDYVINQQIEIDTDALTGLLSRHAYSQALKRLDGDGALPGDLAAFSIDVNGLKTVNDRQGHDAGDELIRSAAQCIQGALGHAGLCYRTGGDEFIALVHMTRPEAEEALRRLETTAQNWRGEQIKELALAAGFALAAEHPDLPAEKLIHEADLAMYAAKSAFYRASGRDRRRARG